MHNDIFVVCYSYRIRKFVDFFLSVTDPSYRFRQSSSSLQNSSYRSNGTTIEVWVTTLGSASLVNEKKYNFVKVKWQKIQLCEITITNCWQQFVISLSQSCIFLSFYFHKVVFQVHIMITAQSRKIPSMRMMPMPLFCLGNTCNICIKSSFIDFSSTSWDSI